MENTRAINSIIELIQKFPTEEECYALLEKLRWNGNVVSPFDSTSQVYKCKGHRYRCRKTGKYFNVRTNTLFEASNIKLQKWFLEFIILQAKNIYKTTLMSLFLGIIQDIWMNKVSLKLY